MPADVIDPPLAVSEQETAIIRAALHRMTDMDRRTLWQVLDLVQATLCRSSDWEHVADAVMLAPPGMVRDTAYQVASLRYPAASGRPAAGGRIPKPAYKTKPLTTVCGRAADPDCYTAGWTWRSFSPDALADVVVRARRPESAVLPVLYRHSGAPVGLTRRWYGCDDGGLDVQLTLLPTERSQYAGRCVRDGLLRGLSLSTRIDDASWCHYSPAEWEPALGRLDMERHHAVTPLEISLTPTPAQGQHSQVRAIW